jgi:phosphoribosylformimino-5-aminoimidazole carboxamide ribotide isomerase
VLIPSIDLQNGRVVQLVQGERLALTSDDLDGWIEKFRSFPIVQVIDLDAAMGRPGNDPIIRRLCAELPCQVGGGVRSIERAQAVIEAGARRVILGSALFTTERVDVESARAFSGAIGADVIVAAVDARGGHVTIHGWKTTLPVTAVQAVADLAPFVGGFLYTHVDTEGTMSGLNLDAVLAVSRATSRHLVAAGGIRSLAEIEHLDELGIDAVVGMAIYTGQIDLSAVPRAPRRAGNTKRDPSV